MLDYHTDPHIQYGVRPMKLYYYTAMSSNRVKVGPTSQTPHAGLWDNVGDFMPPSAAKETLRYEILHMALDLKTFFGTVRDFS